MARRPGDFKVAGERQRTQDLANSLPFPVSEESEGGRGRQRSMFPVQGRHHGQVGTSIGAPARREENFLLNSDVS
jgi:hypothetical protein